MIFLLGTRSSTRVLGTLTAFCVDCRRPTGHILYRRVHRLSVFFASTVPVHYKHFTVCLDCQRALAVTAAEADRLAAYLDGPQALP